MTYVALLSGCGEGCDYTIGCNKAFRVFDAENAEQALEKCQEFFGHYGEDALDSILLFATQEQVPVPIAAWKEAKKKERKRIQAEAELRRAEAQVKALKKTLGH
jgi:hypothetical protein